MKRLLVSLITLTPAVLGLLALTTGLRFGLLTLLLEAYAVIAIAVIVLWLAARGLRFFLWRVGRRLAFSYFLLGVLPIPMVALLLLVAAYLLSGFFLGHLYRNATDDLEAALRAEARLHLEALRDGRPAPRPTLPLGFARYRDGNKRGGHPEAPATWQEWWPAAPLEGTAPETPPASFVALADGTPTMMAAAVAENDGVIAFFTGDLSRWLSEQSGVWVELAPAGTAEDERTEGLRITFDNRTYPLRPPQPLHDDEDLAAFFHPGVETPPLADRPFLYWVELTPAFPYLATGTAAARHLSGMLTGSPRSVAYFLFSRSAAEVDTFAYVVLLVIGLLLFYLYLIAAFMAVLMIVGLSRAVNQLSGATEQVQHGDFSARIRVRRNDQLGALQRSFNQMAANLEDLVGQAAQKELLEKELQIARDLQQSLLPDVLAVPKALRFATHFEPSAAIGGDYYDILPTVGDRLAVFVADVSGHGLPAGLRMAMLKGALQLLVEDGATPERVFARLDRMLRATAPRRGFVTAIFGLIDVEASTVILTNAGHPPTYRLRGGEVSELTLPGAPLGALGHDYGQETIGLQEEDVLVWLSDGLIEAVDDEGCAFGYQGIINALGGLDNTPEAVRDRLLTALRAHTGERVPDDDLTLVVMRYRKTEHAIDDRDETAEKDMSSEEDEASEKEG